MKFCSKCENEEDHGAVCQRIRDVEYEIQQLLDKVDPDTDIEQFAKFIRRNMDQVYCIWHLAEKYFSPSLYKLLFRYAINMKILKPETQEKIVLYNNQILGSKSLIYSISVSLIYLDRLQDACQTILYCLENYEN